MEEIGLLSIAAITAGVWIWVVKCRGNRNLLIANLGGAIGGFIVALMIVSVAIEILGFGRPGSADKLMVSMITATAGIGTWLWVNRIRRAQHPVFRLLIGGVCGLFASVIAFLLSVVILQGS
ncbi:hypothetical protein [Pseudomonas sp. LT1P18]|uniref:hypothetical protein n=1 Tax=Pseudomonas arabinosi TaxID=3398357 RepID=UPI0039EEEAE3